MIAALCSVSSTTVHVHVLSVRLSSAQGIENTAQVRPGTPARLRASNRKIARAARPAHVPDVKTVSKLSDSRKRRSRMTEAKQ